MVLKNIMEFDALSWGSKAPGYNHEGTMYYKHTTTNAMNDM